MDAVASRRKTEEDEEEKHKLASPGATGARCAEIDFIKILNYLVSHLILHQLDT